MDSKESLWENKFLAFFVRFIRLLRSFLKAFRGSANLKKCLLNIGRIYPWAFGQGFLFRCPTGFPRFLPVSADYFLPEQFFNISKNVLAHCDRTINNLLNLLEEN